MPVSYPQMLSTDMVLSEIEALNDWRSQVLRQSFFGGQRAGALEAPSGLIAWGRQEVSRNTLDQKVFDRLLQAHEEMAKAARTMTDHAASGQPVTPALYDSFDNQCDAYVTQIRRLQQDLADSATAVDVVTGLRTVAGMYADIKREQDRFDRKGTAFSIASIEVDKNDELQQRYDRRSMNIIYSAVGHLVARTIRSFDDAYYLGKGEYVIVLKHVDFIDACNVMDRLRQEVADTPVSLPSGERLPVTVSLGVAEIIQGAKPETCVANAKQSRTVARDKGGNSVVEFQERSPLGQLARDISKSGA